MSLAAQRVHQELSDARLSRLPRFVICVGAGWSFFAVKNYFIGVSEIGLLCLGGIFIAAAMYGITGGSEKQRKIVAAVFLFLNMLVIAAIAALTGQHQSCSTIFLCCIGIFASHIVGIRAALVWSIVCSVALIVVNHGFIMGTIEPILVHTPIERTFSSVAAIAILFFFSWQAQHYFNVQTVNLVQLSETLESKAEAFEHLAKHDSLTDLQNRRSFQSMLAESTRACGASG